MVTTLQTLLYILYKITWCDSLNPSPLGNLQVLKDVDDKKIINYFLQKYPKESKHILAQKQY